MSQVGFGWSGGGNELMYSVLSPREREREKEINKVFFQVGVNVHVAIWTHE
jgi:hypothetical protein